MQAEIVRNLAESDQLVEEILLASRLDHAGPAAASAIPVDLLGLAAEEAARIGADATCVSDGGEPVEIDGDATLLRRLIRNLLENAAKHGRPPITIAVTRREAMARIVVADAGEGIAAAERERVFEPFYRPAGRSESSGGWGSRPVAGAPDRPAPQRRRNLRSRVRRRQPLRRRSGDEARLILPRAAGEGNRA
jgi:signal transduction histidine kinase